MPIYEFQCPMTDHVFEKIMPLSMCDIKKVECEFHSMCWAEKVYSISTVKFEAPPTIIFRNMRTGETEVAVNANQPTPTNCIREELHGPIERSKFEKEASLRKYVEDELFSESMKQGREQTAKNIHDDINARMNSVTNKVYNPETKQEENVTWDQETKDLLKRSMAYTRKKHSKIKPRRTNVRLDVNHLDSSNLK